MKLDYQRSGRYFAQVQKGLEEIAVDELEELGCTDCMASYLGVYFNADKATLYKVNYSGKTIVRVLASLFTFKCHSEDILYKNVVGFEWDKVFSVDKTFLISSAVSKSKIKHSQFASLRVKDGIADYFQKKYNKRPDVDKENPDVIINLNINNNKVIISFDTTGFPMYKRGYREQTVPAPIAETLAAAMLRVSGWDGSTKLVDPFCGSGTILAEALMSYCNLPSGFYKKKFGFFSLPDFDQKIWNSVRNSFKSNKELPRDLLIGSDISKNAITAARKNMEIFIDGKNVILKKRDFVNHEGFKNCTIVTNLPYGKRIGNNEEVEQLYKDFGDFLKHKCKGSTAYVMCGSRELVKKIGLRTSRKIQFFNGPIEVRLIELKMY